MSKVKAIIFALLAAVFYAFNVPISKILLNNIGPTTMAAFLTWVQGSVSAFYLCSIRKTE